MKHGAFVVHQTKANVRMRDGMNADLMFDGLPTNRKIYVRVPQIENKGQSMKEEQKVESPDHKMSNQPD